MESNFQNFMNYVGPLLVLYQVKDGSKVGIYTPLILGKNAIISEWKDDMDTFLFNLNQIKKYKKINIKSSLFYAGDHGMYTAEFGNGRSCQTMKRLVHYADYINSYYEKGSEILPSQGKQAYYDLLEVEVFQVIKVKGKQN